MKAFGVLALLALSSFACADVSMDAISGNTAYGYLANIGIPEAERIRQAEEKKEVSRIVGGVPAGLGQCAYQAGLLIDIIGFEGRGICGGSLISANRVITAAHCWYDGRNQGWRVTVVLGSVTLFSGGHRLETSVVVSHPSWFPSLVRNDVAIIYLPNPVTFSNTISPVALPSGSEVLETFAGESAIASGFGLTADGANIDSNQVLSQVNLNVISNGVCSIAFPLILQGSNICSSGLGGVGTCSGDSGGPLVVMRNNRSVLIGVVSFGSALGCQINFPAAYTRVTSYLDFINQHI